MFVYKGSNKKLIEATSKANRLLLTDEFYMAIKNKSTDFDMSTASPEYISEFIWKNKEDVTCNVKTYSKRFTKALAYFTRSRPNDININTYKLNRSMGSIVATLIHEYVHMVDHVDKKHSFGHGSNSRKGKQNTAPYWIDNVAQGMIDGKPDFNNNESSKIVYKRSVWSRVKRFFRRLF